MSLPSMDLKAGQEAYWRIKSHEAYPDRYRYAWFHAILQTFAVATLIQSHLKLGGYATALLAVATYIFILSLIKLVSRREESKYRQDLAFLDRLRSQYGEEAYAEIEKEPKTLRYFLFHKGFPFSRHPSVPPTSLWKPALSSIRESDDMDYLGGRR